jgi:hypothetical protein
MSNARLAMPVPGPSTILAKASITQVSQALAKYLKATEYGEPQSIESLMQLQNCMMSWKLKTGDKALAVGIGTMDGGTLIMDDGLALGQDTAFIKDLSKEINGSVIAAICTNSDRFGLTIAEKGQLHRHFFEQNGKIIVNEGRLPQEERLDPKAPWSFVIGTWQKLQGAATGTA